MWDIYEWYLLHHRGAALRGMGTFLKAQCFTLLLRCPFWFWVFGCLCCGLLSCFLCLLVTPRLLSHLFSLTGESPIKTRCIDDRLSFKRARHRQKIFFPLPLPLPSRGESRGLASDGVSIPFRLPFPLPLPLPFPFPLPLPLGGAPMACGKSVS